jgi:hypothetical protein
LPEKKKKKKQGFITKIHHLAVGNAKILSARRQTFLCQRKRKGKQGFIAVLIYE